MTAIGKNIAKANLKFDFLVHAHVWAARAQQRKELANIPTHLLADLGINEADRQAETLKAFWKK